MAGGVRTDITESSIIISVMIAAAPKGGVILLTCRLKIRTVFLDVQFCCVPLIGMVQ